MNCFFYRCQVCLSLSLWQNNKQENDLYNTITRLFFFFSPISTSAYIHCAGQHCFQFIRWHTEPTLILFFSAALGIRMKYYCFETHNRELQKSPGSQTLMPQDCTPVLRSRSLQGNEQKGQSNYNFYSVCYSPFSLGSVEYKADLLVLDIPVETEKKLCY